MRPFQAVGASWEAPSLYSPEVCVACEGLEGQKMEDHQSISLLAFLDLLTEARGRTVRWRALLEGEKGCGWRGEAGDREKLEDRNIGVQ